MPSTSHRVGRFSESVIRHMTRLANAHGAINLSQGFPDFDPPEELLRAAEQAGGTGRINTRSPGARRTFARPWRASSRA